MKRKIGELRNIPIVEGDKNLVRGGAEIHINDLQTNNSSSSNVSKYAPKYYSIDWSKASENWKYLLCSNLDGACTQCTLFHVASTLKVNMVGFDKPFIIASGPSINDNVNIEAFSFLPVYIDDTSKDQSGGGFIMDGFLDIEKCIELLNSMQVTEYPITMEGITEITEEEYYKMD